MLKPFVTHSKNVLDYVGRLIFLNRHKADVLKLQVGLFYRHLPSTVLTGIGVGTALTWVFYDTAGHYTAIIWTACLYILSILRFSSALIYKRFKDALSDYGWAALGTLLSLLAGLNWGAVAILYFNPASSTDVTVLVVVILGLVSGSISSLSTIPLSYTMYTGTTLLMLSYQFIVSGVEAFISLFIMTIIYGSAMIAFSKNIYQSITYGLRLSIENTELVERLQLEKEKAINANLAKSKFLAAASHDLRQPLQAMTLFTQALKENTENSKNQLVVDRISKSLEALKGLLDSLLDISKLDAGGIQTKTENFDLHPLIAELHNELGSMASIKDQQLNFCNDHCIVFSDPILIKRIIQNLIVNAVTHTPENTIITVAITKNTTENTCTVSVSDNGPGIAEHELERVFEEFYQLDNPERDRNKGLGLGLTIVNRLATLLNIEVKLKSAVDSGCQFSLNVPLANERFIGATSPVELSVDVAHFDNLKVLVVEDDLDVRDALVTLLKSWRCAVWETDDITTAVAFTEQYVIDLVISDYRLRHHETGLELFNTLKSLDKNMPCLLITGDTSAEKLKDFLKEEYLVLHKPIKPAELREAVRMLTS